jgi:hypothetical protein
MMPQEYEFKGGLPTPQTVQASDDADLIRAIEAYKFFFPTVSIANAWYGNACAGMIPNKSFLLMMGSAPHPARFSDTPHAAALIDLTVGPMVVELPPGPMICVVNDLNHRSVMEMGLPGPDAGKGGKHLILPPDHTGKVPEGFFTGRPTTNRVLFMLRAFPPRGEMPQASSN